jgi:hypothetical protein
VHFHKTLSSGETLDTIETLFFAQDLVNRAQGTQKTSSSLKRTRLMIDILVFCFPFQPVLNRQQKSFSVLPIPAIFAESELSRFRVMVVRDFNPIEDFV